MKKLLLLISIIATSLLMNAQNWAWAKNGSATPGGSGKIVTDNTNHSYAIGYCGSNGVVFPGLTIQPVFSGTGMFIVCLDSEGNAVWGKAYKLTPGDIVIDNNLNLYISGGFQDSVVQIDGFNLIKDPGATSSMCLIKMSASGNVLSAFKGKTDSYSYIQKLSTDNNGSLYLSGGFGGDSIIFGSQALYNLNNYYGESFVCKMSAAGTVDWVKPFHPFYSNSSAHRVWIQSIATTSDLDLYVAMDFTDSIFVIENDTIRTNYSLPHTIIIKYDTQGNLLSHHLIEGGNINISLLGDRLNNLILGGNFGSDSLKLGNTTIQNPYASGGSRGTFLAKMENNGSFLWAKSFAGSVNCITTDYSDNVIVGGKYSWQLEFGADTLREMRDPPSHGKPYIACFEANGNYLWSKNATYQGSYWDDYVTGVSAGTDNSVYACGSFSSDTLNFDSIMLMNSAIYHGFPNPPNFFVGKILVEAVSVPEIVAGKIQLYPNPSKGVISLTSHEQMKNIEICDVLGRSCFKRKNMADQRFSLDLSELSPAVYLIKVETESSLITSKLIIER
jgi:hypothetical protein